MIRKILILIFIFTVAFIECKKNSKSSNQEFKLIITVYVDNVPMPGIDVTVGYIEFSRAAGGGTRKEEVVKTNKEGKVLYTLNFITPDTQYLCRAWNPFTKNWSPYRQANALSGMTKKENFYFSSQKK
ncbi:hypothetical protein DRQ09_05985 [candidate division KSB1 bacterium]|nr:MAG: hypothetical protein DRQ09_05985 [candidate division KSB1 bacterium]